MNLFLDIVFATRNKGCEQNILNKPVQWKVCFKKLILSKKLTE